jgi:hypothetical protein
LIQEGNDPLLKAEEVPHRTSERSNHFWMCRRSEVHAAGGVSVVRHRFYWILTFDGSAVGLGGVLAGRRVAQP